MRTDDEESRHRCQPDEFLECLGGDKAFVFRRHEVRWRLRIRRQARQDSEVRRTRQRRGERREGDGDEEEDRQEREYVTFFARHIGSPRHVITFPGFGGAGATNRGRHRRWEGTRRSPTVP